MKPIIFLLLFLICEMPAVSGADSISSFVTMKPNAYLFPDMDNVCSKTQLQACLQALN